MSEKKQDLSKNSSDYGYTGEEVITMTPQQFIAIRRALEKAMANGTEVRLPQRLRYADAKTNEPLESATQKQLKEGRVKQVGDIQSTFNQANHEVTYNANIYPEVYGGLQTWFEVHEDMVENDVAKPADEVKRFFEEREAKGQMKVEDDEEAEVVEDPKVKNIKKPKGKK